MNKKILLSLASVLILAGCANSGENGYSKVKEHEHSFSSGWVMDQNSHWHSCSTNGCNEKQDESGHTFGMWITAKPATVNNAGLEKRTCTQCGYSETRALQKHSFLPNWTYDANNHWHQCASSGCLETSTAENHQMTDWTITKEATSIISGTKERHCSICQYTETQTYSISDQKQVFDLVLVTGQSNGVGYSQPDYYTSREAFEAAYPISEDLKGNSYEFHYDIENEVGSLTDIDYFNGDKMYTQQMKNEGTRDYHAEPCRGHSIVPGFAEGYYKLTGRKTIMIHCCMGGLSLSKFLAGEDIYNDCVKKTNACLDFLEKNCPNVEIGHKFYIMVQGESDTNDDDTSKADKYYINYKKFNDQIRQELGFELGEIVQLGRHGGIKDANDEKDYSIVYWNGIYEIARVKYQLAIEEESLIMGSLSAINFFSAHLDCMINSNNPDMVSTDRVHMNGKGQRIVGTECATSLANYLGFNTEHPELEGIEPALYLEQPNKLLDIGLSFGGIEVSQKAPLIVEQTVDKGLFDLANTQEELYQLDDKEEQAARDVYKVMFPNLTYASDNTSIATIDEFGTITGISNGTCNITVENSDKSISKSIEITVSKNSLYETKATLMPDSANGFVVSDGELVEGTSITVGTNAACCYLGTGSEVDFTTTKITNSSTDSILYDTNFKSSKFMNIAGKQSTFNENNAGNFYKIVLPQKATLVFYLKTINGTYGLTVSKDTPVASEDTMIKDPNAALSGGFSRYMTLDAGTYYIGRHCTKAGTSTEKTSDGLRIYGIDILYKGAE